jgi:hypothetical protein
MVSVWQRLDAVKRMIAYAVVLMLRAALIFARGSTIVCAVAT